MTTILEQPITSAPGTILVTGGVAIYPGIALNSLFVGSRNRSRAYAAYCAAFIERVEQLLLGESLTVQLTDGAVVDAKDEFFFDFGARIALVAGSEGHSQIVEMNRLKVGSPESDSILDRFNTDMARRVEEFALENGIIVRAEFDYEGYACNGLDGLG